MFDMKRTADLIAGAALKPQTTWDAFLPGAGDWQRTAIQLTVPVIVGSSILAYLVALVLGSRWLTPTIAGTLLQILFAFGAAALAAFVFAFLAGIFGGRNSFALALAATQLAFVPGYIGQIVQPIPWLGWIASLALSVYSLVLLWRILPSYLGVPETARVKHYAASLATCIVAMLIITSIVGINLFGAAMRSGELPVTSSPGIDSTTRSTPSGLFGNLERQGNLVEQADADTYEPPADGRITENQMENYLRVLARTRELRADQTEKLERLSAQADNKEIRSLGQALSGIGEAVGLATAEMEVVKTAGGNWAEHSWVKEQLQVARVQKDLNDAVKHNYALYQQYQAQLTAE